MNSLYMFSIVALAMGLLLSGMVGPSVAQPPVLLAQYGSSGAFDRDSCIQNCRDWIGLYQWGGGRGYDRSYLYARCIQDCDSRFWNEFDRKMDDLKRE
ncbi:MAG: hypothetical protein HY913_17655 [Desulfomonile tiedjei]|nr:hypothetical protein [Desulfomonile tiedjei]